jgi:hypothetical protein
MIGFANMKIERRHIGLILFLMAIITATILQACEKVINVDLNEAAPVIVIEGMITDRSGPYQVTISRSGSYFDQPVLPVVSGAFVTISVSSGLTDTLKEIRPGLYLTSKLKGIPGKTYNLKVKADNQEYTASSTMPVHVNLDSLGLAKSQFGRFHLGTNEANKEDVDLHCFFFDPPEKNYYRVNVYINDTLQTGFYRLYDDQYANGGKTELRVGHAKEKHTFTIELLSIDRQTFNYFRTLEDIIYSNPIFGSTPANPDPVITNGALGYFGACAVSSRAVTITREMLDAVRQ